MSCIITTLWDDYFMFLKVNFKTGVSPTNRDAATAAEIELRKRQAQGIALLREFVPGCEQAFIARTSPQLTIRRARCIQCDYDISLDDVLQGRHFDDDVLSYGFHDSAPRLQVKGGGSYGVPYRALCVSGPVRHGHDDHVQPRRAHVHSERGVLHVPRPGRRHGRRAHRGGSHGLPGAAV